MTLKELRSEAWDIAREVGTSDSSRLWTTKEMNRYINRIYRHIARETRCIRDARTTAVCRLPVVPPQDLDAFTALAATDPWAADDLERYNDPDSWMYIPPQDIAGGETLEQYEARWAAATVAPMNYTLHPSILDIDEAKWKVAPWRLTKVSVTKWQANPRWEQIIGYPIEYCVDYQSGALTLGYRTRNADEICLTVRRLPLVDLVGDSDVPEIRLHYHDFFINGILWQMYSKQDVETFDLETATSYKKRFEADLDEIKQQETIFDQRLKVNYSMSGFR